MPGSDSTIDLQNIMESLESKKGTFKLLWIPMVLERLEKVEKQNKRLSMINTFLLIAVFGLMGVSLTKTMNIGLSGRVTSKQVVLKGSELQIATPDDKIVAILHHGDGKPKLHLLDPQSKAEVRIGFNNNMEPALSLLDKNGKLRTMLALSTKEDGSPGLQLYDNIGKLRTALGAGNMDKKEPGGMVKWPIASLVLFDEQGNIIWRTPAELSASTSTPGEPRLPDKAVR